MSDSPTTAGDSLRSRVAAVIEKIRPYIQGDGGDIELVDIDADNAVHVRLRGACSGCPSAAMTLKMGVERAIKQQVPEITEVVRVG
jgi:Fe-S cluster biogenesis protein NfuA